MFTNDLSAFPTSIKSSFDGIKDTDEDFKNHFLNKLITKNGVILDLRAINTLINELYEIKTQMEALEVADKMASE